jgi:hypothetical protein
MIVSYVNIYFVTMDKTLISNLSNMALVGYHNILLIYLTLP